MTLRKLTCVPPHHTATEPFSRSSEANWLQGYTTPRKHPVSCFSDFKTEPGLVANANSLHSFFNNAGKLFYVIEAVVYIRPEYGTAKRATLPGTAVSRQRCAHAQVKSSNFL
ncbi:uncharacterized [Tachysurus ichikawai]